jgi:Concanavalin A-like lectin/glucanases superfamily
MPSALIGIDSQGVNLTKSTLSFAGFPHLLNGIYSYWSFDSKPFTDSTGNGRTLVQTNQGLVVTSGVLNNCVRFSGDGSTYLKTPSVIWSGTETALSISLWIKTSNTFFAFSAATNTSYSHSGPELTFYGSSQFFDVFVNNDGSLDRVALQKNVQDGVWHHVVGTWNRYGSIKVYCDGVLDSSVVSSGSAINSTINYPSVINGNGDHTFDVGQAGYIDELGVWKRELTPADVYSLYGNGTPPSYSNFTS